MAHHEGLWHMHGLGEMSGLSNCYSVVVKYIPDLTNLWWWNRFMCLLNPKLQVWSPRWEIRTESSPFLPQVVFSNSTFRYSRLAYVLPGVKPPYCLPVGTCWGRGTQGCPLCQTHFPGVSAAWRLAESGWCWELCWSHSGLEETGSDVITLFWWSCHRDHLPCPLPPMPLCQSMPRCFLRAQGGCFFSRYSHSQGAHIRNAWSPVSQLLNSVASSVHPYNCDFLQGIPTSRMEADLEVH